NSLSDLLDKPQTRTPMPGDETQPVPPVAETVEQVATGADETAVAEKPRQMDESAEVGVLSRLNADAEPGVGQPTTSDTGSET
ncbi:hypothetical protein NLM59_11595, partial [Weeksellaceae bacterium KMM 9724]